MYLGLTGPPRVTSPGGAVVYGDQASVEARAVPEPVVWEGRGGAETVVEPRYRVVGRVVWAGLAEAEAAALQADLGHLSTVEVRTEAEGDFEWARELALPVRRTSDVEVTAPLRPYHSATGRPVATVSFTFRSVDTVATATGGVLTYVASVLVDADGIAVLFGGFPVTAALV